jgi:hypothetical protein
MGVRTTQRRLHADRGLRAALKAASLPEARRWIETGAGLEVTQEEHGFTTLMLAAKRGDLDVYRVLLERAAKVDARSKTGETALFWAVESSLRNQAIARPRSGPPLSRGRQNGRSPVSSARRRSGWRPCGSCVAGIRTLNRPSRDENRCRGSAPIQVVAAVSASPVEVSHARVARRTLPPLGATSACPVRGHASIGSARLSRGMPLRTREISSESSSRRMGLAM